MSEEADRVVDNEKVESEEWRPNLTTIVEVYELKFGLS